MSRRVASRVSSGEERGQGVSARRGNLGEQDKAVLEAAEKVGGGW